MRLIILLLTTLIFLSCNKKNEETVTAEATQEQLTMEDSLLSVADSIADVRRMHAVYQGQHVHNPSDDLAAVAHQDPELDRQIRRSIRDNRERQLEVYEDQNKKMFDMIREKQAKDSIDSIAE